MRKFNETHLQQDYKIIAVDDEEGIIDSLEVVLKRSGYQFTGVTNPMDAIEMIRKEHFDLLILDFLMYPYHGDQVVEEIRKFNKDLYILLLTGHKDLAPPLETIRQLDIQGYCEKGNKFDQLLLLIESGIKSIKQMREITRMNEQLIEANKKIENAYLESIETLKCTVEARDPYTEGHSDRVSKFSVLIGKKMGLKDTDIEILHIGGLFHDVGKIGIPDSILLKNSKLTDEEYAKIKEHPVIGERILSGASIFADILPIVRHHHERFDGRGYPDGLAGEEIPLLARITSVADSFDAMSSRRTYRTGLSMDVIIEEIRKNRGTQFDPDIADVFLDILENDMEDIIKIQNGEG